MKNLITSIIYSFKDSPFNMADILYLANIFAANHGQVINIEEVCATVDTLAEAGTIEFITMSDGKGALKLSANTLTTISNETPKR